IALMVPLGLKLIENWLFKKNSSRNGLNIGIISIIAIIFAMSAFYTASSEFSSLGPSISEQQYNDLVNIKANYLQDKIDPNGIIVVNEYHTGYWAQYMLGMQVETGNTNEIQEKYPNRTIYMLTLSENKQSGLNGMNGYSWNPLLPYSFPFGGFNVMNSSNGHSNATSPPNNERSRGNGAAPPMDRSGNKTPFNSSGSMPPNLGNMTQNKDPGSLQMPDQNFNQLSSIGTLIFSADNLKIYKIS
ncbi:MAG: hypothetical protein ACXVHR_05885, partial [Methanobacterium sp.]